MTKFKKNTVLKLGASLTLCFYVYFICRPLLPFIPQFSTPFSIFYFFFFISTPKLFHVLFYSLSIFFFFYHFIFFLCELGNKTRSKAQMSTGQGRAHETISQMSPTICFNLFSVPEYTLVLCVCDIFMGFYFFFFFAFS